MRWKNLPGLVLLLASGLLLASCLTVELQSTLEEDGSGLHVYHSTIDRDVMDDFGDLADEGEVEADFEASEETAREMGYEVERIDTDEHLGIRLSRDYEDSENVGRILNDLFSIGADEPISAFTGIFTRSDNIHTLDLTVNGSELFGDELDEDGISPEMLSGFITMTYTVSMPGEIVEEDTNGRILADGRVEWDLPLSGTRTFTAVSETEGDGISTLLLVGVIGLLFLFIGGAALLALFLLLRSRRAPAAAPEGAYTTDPDAPTAPFPHAQADPNKPPAQNF